MVTVISGGGGGGIDYVQDSEPTDAEEGEEWYDKDADKTYIYDGTTWVKTSRPAAGDGLSDMNGTFAVVPGTGLAIDGNGNVYVPAGALAFDRLAFGLSTGLAFDGNGDLGVPPDALAEDRLAFDTATQSELDSHAGRTDNPHGVTDDQTGAAAALDSHATRTDNPHNVDDSQTGAASALSDHASDSNAHHSRPTGTQNAGAAPNGLAEVHDVSDIKGGQTASYDVESAILVGKVRIDWAGNSLLDITLEDSTGSVMDSRTGVGPGDTVEFPPTHCNRIEVYTRNDGYGSFHRMYFNIAPPDVPQHAHNI